MIRVLFVLLIITLQHHADTISPAYPPLFAEVIDVAEDDLLNVRESHDHNSNKIGALPLGAIIGVSRCQKIKNSVWCEVYPMTQISYEGFGGEVKGWVNARYLKPMNSGYVLIDGLGNCDYAVQCKENKYEVLSSYDVVKGDQTTHVKTKWIERSRLKGESNFGAMKQEEDGSCPLDRYIEDFIKSKKFKGFSKKYH